MSQVLDGLRQKYPVYEEVPDKDLILGIGNKHPVYLKDEEFAKEFSSAGGTVPKTFGERVARRVELEKQVTSAKREVGAATARAFLAVATPPDAPLQKRLVQEPPPDEEAPEVIYEGGAATQMGIGLIKGYHELGRAGNAVLESVARMIPGETAKAAAEQFAGASKVAKERSMFYEELGRETAGPEFSRTVGSGVTSLIPAIAAGPAGLAGMATASALQSFGGTFADTKDYFISKGLSEDDAAAGAYAPALASGLITGLVTGGFGKTGVEALRTAVRSKSFGEFAKNFAKQSGMESGQEFWDQVGQTVVSKLSSNPGMTLEQAMNESITAGLVGGIMGGGVTAVGETQTQLQKVAPLTAQAVSDTTQAQTSAVPPIEQPEVVSSIGTQQPVAVESIGEVPTETVTEEKGGLPSEETKIKEEEAGVLTPPLEAAAPTGAVSEPTAPELVGMGGAVPSEFELKPGSPTSIRNAQVDKEREARGLSPAVQPVRRAFGTVWDKAMQRVDEDPGYQDTLIEELRKRPRALTDEEDAIVLHRQIDLQNEYEKSAQRVNDAFQSGDEDRLADAKSDLDMWSNRLQDIYDIGKRSGTETARGLNARKMAAFHDFSLARMEMEKRAAKGGAPLTDSERAELTELQQKLAQTQKAFDEYVANTDERLAQAASVTAVSDLNKEVSTEAKAPKPAPSTPPGTATVAGSPSVSKTPATDRDAVIGAIKNKITKGEQAEISSLVQKLAKHFIANGITERDPLIDAVHTALTDVVPGITRRDTMDAISGYGQYKQLSKDEISVKLRDLKGQMQQVGKLQDMAAGMAPQKTGIERRTPTDEERRLIKLVEEAKKKGGYTVTDPATQLRTALQSVKTRLEHEIADLEHQIATGERITKEKRGITYDEEANRLKARRDELKTEFDKIFGQKELTDEQRVRMAMGAVERSIAEYERRIKEGDLTPAKKVSKTPLTPELESARARRDALKEQLQEMRDLATPKKTPEEIALQSLKTRLANETAKLKEKLAAGDFTTKPKREIKLDQEATKLKFEHEKVKRKWLEGLVKDRLKNRTLPQKIMGGLGEALNTFRAIMTSFDFSAVLRQGGFISFGHPIRSARSFPAMFRAFRSEAGQFKVEEEIRSRPNYRLYQRHKLYLSEHGQKLSQMEEQYMSRIAGKIPGVAASQRAYTTFLNKLRADSFDIMTRTLGRSGDMTQKELDAITNFINVSTGRGKLELGKREDALVGLNTIFFAPRYVASRFQLALGQPLYGGSGRTRTAVAKEYARFGIGLGVVYALAMAAGAEMEDDPRSSDFGKLKIGNVRIDPLAGLQQVTVLMSRLGKGETKNLKGEIVPIRGEKVPFGKATAADVLGRFMRTKLSPAVGAGVDVATGKNVVGQTVTPGSVVANLAVPITGREIVQAIQDQGLPRGVALGIASLFGFGLQVYENRE